MLHTHHFLERTGEQCLSAEREGACCVFFVFFLKLRLKLVFRGSAHLSQMVLSHITISAISTWSGHWTVLTGVPWASTPTTFSTGGLCRFLCQLIDLLFEFRVDRVHNSYIGIVSCFPRFCTGKLFIKCVGCFPVFLVMVKKQFSKVFVVNARAQAVSMTGRKTRAL